MPRQLRRYHLLHISRQRNWSHDPEGLVHTGHTAAVKLSLAAERVAFPRAPSKGRAGISIVLTL
jgi:hypothetical protein